ncbi:hypothetical protein OKA04_09015 [Luteolibacter flavescens]|uniref:Uncharacterized protein n=1 Tax=Luteolibacter flavescens TaxID=1859460 RepID=A0ABT3FMS1_9BACT|nr:hypothetical protein [Luteolibacter flavescens]MCW1884867.1 hypothetical protein [Luteolibacter flavescens]
MPVSAQEALAQARRSRPDPLPANFADEVMARLHAAAKSAPVALPRPRDLVALAAMAMLVAGGIGFLGGSPAPRAHTSAPSSSPSAPPPLTMFSGPSLFATR